MNLYKADGTLIPINSGGNNITAASKTALRIAETDKAFWGGIVDASGYCITNYYPITVFTQRKIELILTRPSSQSKATKFVLLQDETEIDSYNTSWTDKDSPAAVSKTISTSADNCAKVNAIRFTLFTAEAEYACAYWQDSGEIIFAGKNSKYYGMSNVFGTRQKDADIKAFTGTATIDAAKYDALPSAYVNGVVSAYQTFIADCKDDVNKIPIIVHTDAHNKLNTDGGKQIMNLIGDITDWRKVSKILCLGDVGSSWLQAVQNHPLDKRIDMWGNHEIYGLNGVTYQSNQQPLVQYILNPNIRWADNNGYYTVIDEKFNVKYVVMNGNDFLEHYETEPTNQSAQAVKTKQMNFLIDELSKADGYDVILAGHNPINASNTSSDGTTWSDWAQFADATLESEFKAMLDARKNKTNGTVHDSEGVSHSYDFSGCNSDFLISLHGHAHKEGYYTSSWTQFVFSNFYGSDGNAYDFCFGYIDRATHKFKRWRCSANETFEPWEIDIS